MRRWFPIVCALAILACSGCATRDAENYCLVAQEVQADDSIAPEFKLLELNKRFEPSSGAFENIVLALADAPGEERYEMLEHAVRVDVGAKDWSCPALEELFDPARQ